jgi:dihydrolipoamide dehydrogenase
LDQPFDVVVIGSGPGGYVAAIRAAQLGLRAAVVEREFLGGVCLNVGCIPTKAMLRTAELYDTFKRAAEFGIQADGVRLDYARVLERRDQVVSTLSNGVAGLLKSNGVAVFRGSGRFLDRNRVAVSGGDGGETTLETRNVIVATGSTPAELPVPGGDHPRVIDSNEALALKEVPESVLVVGAGAVGCEWGQIFASFGARVTLVEMLPTLLPLEDEELGKALERIFRKKGIEARTGTKVGQIVEGDDGALVATLVGPDGREERVSAQYVLSAVGRRPNTAGLGAEVIGLEQDRRGFIVVDERLRTNVPGVYAIGDVTGKQLLAHLASHQGIVAAENIAGQSKEMEYHVVPAVTFTHPEVASVGLSEVKAREAGHDVRVGRFPFAASGRALAYGETDGFVKLVTDAKYGEVLGAHIIGPQAGDLIAEIALAMRLEATVEDIAATIHVHPTLAESVMEAALASVGMAIHIARPRR